MFGFRIISETRYAELLEKEATFHDVIKFDPGSVNREPKVVHNCGYKSCQFQTTDPTGLKIHRSRIHKNK